MIFSIGFVYRWGQRVKDPGERMAHARVFGVPLFRWLCGPVIGLGLGIKNAALSAPAGEL
jgi:hypothetical protein